jgi:triosephosphate isomerase
MRTKLVIGNWKLNGNFAFNEQLLRELSAGIKDSSIEDQARQMVVCPPAVYLQHCSGLLASAHIHLGAQDVSDEISGAFTGEISGMMLKELGCRYVLVGHSERRARHAESNELVAKKAFVALDAGLSPVVCLGETQAERDHGLTEKILSAQLQAVIDLLQEKMARVVLAYEPIWAIGTGLTATPEQAQEVHRFLRLSLAKFDPEVASKVLILYGGSVKADNAKSLFEMADIDGALVGGASLKADEFLNIYKA